MQTTNKTENPEDTPLTPDEIKAIGEIELGPAKHEVFLNKHYKKLIFGGIALAVVATIATAWYAYGEQQKKEAGAHIVNAVTNASPDALQIVLDDYADTPSAETASFLKAEQDLRDPAFTDFSVMQQLADNAKSETVRLLACYALANRYTKDGDSDNAALYLKKVINFPRNVYTAHAYICLCDIAWNKGDKEQALMYLKQGRDACPESLLFKNRAQVDVRFDVLESGVDAPVDPIFVESMDTTSQTAPVATDAAATPTENSGLDPVNLSTPNPTPELKVPASTLDNINL